MGHPVRFPGSAFDQSCTIVHVLDQSRPKMKKSAFCFIFG